MTELIDAYTFTLRPVVAYESVFDSKTKKFKAVSGDKFSESRSESLPLHEILDGITLATEAGTVEQKGWVAQFFADKAAYEFFLDELRAYDEVFRVTDRWWAALSRIIDYGDEESFITGSEIAEKLNDYVEETGQLSAFKKPARKR